jgi:hypothetical protein
VVNKGRGWRREERKDKRRIEFQQTELAQPVKENLRHKRETEGESKK